MGREREALSNVSFEQLKSRIGVMILADVLLEGLQVIVVIVDDREHDLLKAAPELGARQLLPEDHRDLLRRVVELSAAEGAQDESRMPRPCGSVEGRADAKGDRLVPILVGCPGEKGHGGGDHCDLADREAIAAVPANCDSALSMR